MPKFSVLMSAYAGDDPVHLERALVSVSRDQQLAPDQIVLVQDGPVPADLAAVIDRAAEICAPVPVTPVPLPDNRGLALALRAGMRACEHDVIARADADDICLPERFARQIPLMEDLDLLGSAIAEFHDDAAAPGLVRALPETAAEIRAILPLRDPFNHPSVVLRASAAAQAGGYDNLTCMEDYWLFARMVQAGARVANLPDVLVLYRVGDGAYHRRGGWRMLRGEWQLQRAMRQAGMTTPVQYVRNLAVRGGYRLIPAWVRRPLYRVAMRTRWKR
ncbi:MAG: glycosyltransferase [Bowdeniella nasicola]|nr:glycosyltransferase [Bowdeniella nasicola]